MMEVENESFEAIVPDIEVIVRSGEQELAVIGVFQNKSNVWDILIGVDDRERSDQLATLFEQLASALSIASFAPVRSAGIQQLSFLAEEPAKSHYAQDK